MIFLEELFEECLLNKVRELDGVELINDTEESLMIDFDLDDVMSNIDFPIGLTRLFFPRYFFDPYSFEYQDEDANADLSEH
ncbi:hypothetical protein QW180_19890 [Vibrio sinaloensis]|nr:hypothetical protein [Vibrio sinaloensis]